MARATRNAGARIAFMVAAITWAVVALTVGDHGVGGTASPPAELVSAVSGAPTTPLPTYDYRPSISSDGRFEVFMSYEGSDDYPVFEPSFFSTSTPLVAQIRDRVAGTTSAVPLLTGVETVHGAVISGDGCHVAYWGWITPPGESYAGWRVYLWDRCPTSSTPRAVTVGRDWYGPTELAISDDGSRIVYGDGNGDGTGWVTLVSTTTGTISERDLFLPEEFGFDLVQTITVDISGNGSVVAAGVALRSMTDYDDYTWAVLGWTLAAGGDVPEVISVGAKGELARGFNADPSLSRDGSVVAFVSSSPAISGLDTVAPQLYVRDRPLGSTQLVSGGAPDVGAAEPDLDADGEQVVYATYTFVEPPTSDTTPTSVPPVPDPYDYGRSYEELVAPSEISLARSTSGTFATSETELISFGVDDGPVAGRSRSPKMSATGRFVTFGSIEGGARLSGLSGFADSGEVWLRERAPALLANSPIDFGTVVIGSSSEPRTATVTNTGKVRVLLGAVAVSAPAFSISTDGCGGRLLQPGGSCNVELVFRPVAAVASEAQLTFTGEGISTSSTLRGTGAVPTTAPPDTTTTTTAPTTTTSPATTSTSTTTTVRATTTTTTRPTTTTTLPPGRLAVEPTSVELPETAVGQTSSAVTVTVRNIGGRSVVVGSIDLDGAGAGNFVVIDDSCTGITLPARSTCVVLIAARPLEGGEQLADFIVRASGVEPAVATVRVGALFAPTMVVNPGVVRPGEVTLIIGAGFPAARQLQLTFDDGATIGSVTTDVDGRFEVQMLILRNGIQIGGRQVLVTDQPDFSGVFAPVLIDQASFQPSGGISPALTNGLAAIVGRNG